MNKEDYVYKDALIYCRVSTENQAQDGNGLQSQEQRCREYAKRHDYHVEKVFFDSASGGGDFMKRPGMVKLLKYLDDNFEKNYIVIFDDLKRFARDTEFHIKLKADLKARKVRPECLNYTFDDSPEGTFSETIFAATGQLEREQNKRQVLQKMRARLEDGYWPFYPIPGYVSKKVPGCGKVLSPKDPEAKIIKEALEGFASNRFHNIVDVTNFLISKGMLLNNGKNHVQRAIDLLRRPMYAGYIEYPKWKINRIDGKHEPLISKECYAKIEARLNSNIKNKARKDISSDFPLRNFICCSNCGKLLTASWSTGRTSKHPYYRCTGHDCIYKNKSISRDNVDKSLSELLEKLIPRKELLDFVKAKLYLKWNDVIKNLNLRKDSISNEIKKYDNDISFLVKKMINVKIDLVTDAIGKEIEVLSQKKKVTEGKLYDLGNVDFSFGTALDVIFKILKNPYIEWQNGNLTYRRVLLGMIFMDNIPYDRKTGFGTAKLQLPIKVFCQNKDTNSCDVEMVRIELTCK